MYIPAQRNVLWVVAFFGFVMVKRSGSGTDMFFPWRGESSTFGVVALCNRPAALDATMRMHNYNNYKSVYMLICMILVTC